MELVQRNEPIWQEQIHVQYSYFEDHIAYVCVSGKWVAVKLWLWANLVLPDGIQGIVDYWQGGILKKYRHVRYERMALQNLQDDAEAIYKFYRNPREWRYRRMLTPIERQALIFERKVTAEYPHMDGRVKFEEVAAQMNKSSLTRGQGIQNGMFLWWQVADLIEAARDALVAELRLSRDEKLQKQIREWQQEIKVLAATETLFELAA